MRATANNNGHEITLSERSQMLTKNWRLDRKSNVKPSEAWKTNIDYLGILQVGWVYYFSKNMSH